MKPRTSTTIRVFLIFVSLLFFLATDTPANKKPPLKPININTATSDELQQVPGIGPVTAEKILTMRKSYGAFKSVDDLLAIKGLGKKRLEKMRKYLTVSKGVPTKQPPKHTPPPPAEEESPPT